MYFASAFSIKISLILFYHRVFGIIAWFRWLLVVLGTLTFIFFAVCLLVAVFECHPVAFFWNKWMAHGTCINQLQLYRWSGVANLLLDFAIWSVTLPVIWRLNLNTRQKLSLSAVFLLGLL